MSCSKECDGNSAQIDSPSFSLTSAVLEKYLSRDPEYVYFKRCIIEKVSSMEHEGDWYENHN